MVAIGLISYPLYLWHWPLLSFAHLYDTATPSLLTRTALAVLSFPLAAATYHFVEKPIRFGPRGEQKAGGKKAAVLLGLLLAVGALGIGIYAKQGFPGRTIVNQKRAPVDRGLGNPKGGDPVPPCAGRESLPPELATICASHLNAGAKQRVVLWGDLHAAVWAMPLVRLAKERGFELYVLRHDGCPPIEGVWRPANNASITLCETPDIMRRIEDGIVGPRARRRRARRALDALQPRLGDQRPDAEGERLPDRPAGQRGDRGDLAGGAGAADSRIRSAGCRRGASASS